MGNVQEKIDQAMALERAQNHGAALDSFMRLSSEPGPHTQDPAFWLKLAELARRRDRPEEAADAYARATDLLASAGSRNSALAVARRLTRVAPDSATAGLRYGRLALELGYAAEASDAFLRAAAAAPLNGELDEVVDGLRETWVLLQQQGLDDAAEAVRAKLAELRPDAVPPPGPPGPAAAEPARAPAGRPDEPGELDKIDELDELRLDAEPESPASSRSASPSDGLEDLLTSLDFEPTAADDELPALEGLEPTGPQAAGIDDPGAGLPGPEAQAGRDDDLQLDRPFDQGGELLSDSDLHLDQADEVPESPTRPAEGEDAPSPEGGILDWTAGFGGDVPSLDEPPAAAGADASAGEAGRAPTPAASGDPDSRDGAPLQHEEPPSDVELPFLSGDLDQAFGSLRESEPDAAPPAAEGGEPAPAGEAAPPRPPAGDASGPQSPESTTAGAEREAPRAPVAEGAPPREREEAEPPAPPSGPPAPPTPAAQPPADDYIDLASLILGDEEESGTRFLTDAAGPPSGDEDRDFAEILSIFRQKVSEKIHPQDSSSHYDLGVAYKEMGLLDDAIGQLQLALRAGSSPVATLEVIGECFIEKGEPALAKRVLERATVVEDTGDSDLVGVLYLLGRCAEVLADPGAARGYYERVIAVDISFRDAASRLKGLRGDTK